MSGPAASPLPKYKQVYNSLREDIAAGILGVGQRLPSEADLVKAFGASRITVGRALRDLQQEGLIERRAGSGSYVRGQREASASRLAFGLLIPDLGDTEILEPIVRSLTSAPAAKEHGFYSGSAPSDLSPEQREQAALDRCRQYVERDVAGVFFAPLELTPHKDAINARIIETLDAAGIPVVLLDRSVVPYGQPEPHDLVGIDNRRAGYQITDHLLRLGARRVAFVSLANAASTVDARRAGYREALHCHGLWVEPSLAVELEAGAHEEIAPMMDRLAPDAIVCANDRLAGLVMHGLLALGYAIPEAVRIAGIDDVHYASLLPVPLTTLRQPCRAIGAAAMAAMLERVTRPNLPPRDIFLQTPLVVRQSCGACPLPGSLRPPREPQSAPAARESQGG